jgi:hypothetical protein
MRYTMRQHHGNQPGIMYTLTLKLIPRHQIEPVGEYLWRFLKLRKLI